MNVQQSVAAFLARHGFSAKGYDINTVIDGLLFDMEKGLCEQTGEGALDASQNMIPTWSMPPAESPKNERVIVIDAGGTNFRSCLVTFDEKGESTISDLEKTSMPGIERELNKKDFFDAIAANLDRLKNKAKRIGFCFSYAMNITPDGDGEVIKFSKEIKAKEVEGSLVGACLSAALVARGWDKPEKITLLNDTTAALLAGSASAIEGRAFSSYVGFILGTGMNSAYIESGSIGKIGGVGTNGAESSNGATCCCGGAGDSGTGAAKGAANGSAVKGVPKAQIVVCESGRFNKIQKSDFDIEFDKTTNTPGLYIMEKMCSGAYLGPVACVALKAAAKDGLFSENVARAILGSDVEACATAGSESGGVSFELKDMDQFFYYPRKTDTILGKIVAKGTQQDADTIYTILDAIVERSARLASALIAAAVIKSGKGTSPALPVGIVCNGTTFYKTHNLQYRLRGYLNEVLIAQRHLYFEILSVENDITIGTAVAGLS